MGKWRKNPQPTDGGGGGGKKKPQQGDGGGKYATPQNGYNPGQTRDRYNDLIDRGVDASQDPRLQVGDDYTRRLLDSKNFDSTNDYLSSLWRDLDGANYDEGLGMLRQFLGDGYGGGGSGSGGAGFYTDADGRKIQTGGSFGGNYASRGPGGASAAGSGGILPDTMKQGGWVADQIKNLFDPSRLDPANDPTMQPYLKALREESMEGWAKEKAALDASAEGRGRYGSGLYRAMSGDLTQETAKELDRAMASALFGSREAALGRQMQGIGIMDSRDKAAMQDMTQRYGIDSAAAASGAASSAASESAKRGQDLAAISQLLNHHQFGLGMKQGIGNFFGQMQQGALGNIPGMQTASNQGLQLGLGGANGMAGLDLGLAGLDIQKLMSQNQLRGTMAHANAANASTNLQRDMWTDGAAQRDIDNLLKIIMGVGGMGGTQWGQGPPPNFFNMFAGMGGGGGR